MGKAGGSQRGREAPAQLLPLVEMSPHPHPHGSLGTLLQPQLPTAAPWQIPASRCVPTRRGQQRASLLTSKGTSALRCCHQRAVTHAVLPWSSLLLVSSKKLFIYYLGAKIKQRLPLCPTNHSDCIVIHLLYFSCPGSQSCTHVSPAEAAGTTGLSRGEEALVTTLLQLASVMVAVQDIPRQQQRTIQPTPVRRLLRQQLELDAVLKGTRPPLSPSRWVDTLVEIEVLTLGDSHADTPAVAPTAMWDCQWLFWGAPGCRGGHRLGVLGLYW